MVRGEGRAIQVARAFFRAATKLSDDTEDILPQVTMKQQGFDQDGDKIAVGGNPFKGSISKQ